MATYSPESLKIAAPSGGFQEGGWYSGRQYIGGTLSDPGVIHPGSSQQGAGSLVSKEVNAQSAQAQGQTPQQIESYLESQRRAQPSTAKTISSSPSTTGMGSGSMGAGMGNMASVQPIDLTETYRRLTQESGISQKEEELAALERQLTETKGKINDNPYLSEATRVGRVAKLDQLHNDRTANIRNEIATKKADVDMLLNLQTKQFDINNQAAQTALSQFNSLLEMGALDNAGAEDIANITRTTGLSSALIQSAVAAKKVAGYQTTTKTFDDGANEGFVIYTIDPQGNIVNQVKQITGTSSKSTSQYSEDPGVSSFFAKYLDAQKSANDSGSLDAMWDL